MPAPRPLFPDGLRLAMEFGSFEDFEAAAVSWNLETDQIEPGRYRGRLLAMHTSRMQVAWSFRSLGTVIRGSTPSGALLLSLPLTSNGPTQFHGREVGETDLLVQDDASGLDFSFRGTMEVLTVAVERAELEQRARCLWPETGEMAWRRRRMSFASHAQAHRAGSAVMSLLRDAMQHGSRGLALDDAVLDALLGRLEAGSAPAPARERHRAARRSAAFLLENWDADLSLAAVCAAVGASRRTLHEGFLELYGLPPMAFLRCVRLCRARRRLESGGTVTSAATRSGFDHLGRFAEAYRRHFGERPSETLRLAGGRAGSPATRMGRRLPATGGAGSP